MKYLLLTIVLSIFSMTVSANDYPMPFSHKCSFFISQFETLAKNPTKIGVKVFRIYWTTEAAEVIGITYLEWESYCTSLETGDS